MIQCCYCTHVCVVLLFLVAMEPLEIIDISKDAIYVLLKISSPVIFTGMFVGLIVSLFQALTQIQEMTLSFVPKVIAIFFSLLLFSSFIGNNLSDFSERVMFYMESSSSEEERT